MKKVKTTSKGQNVSASSSSRKMERTSTFINYEEFLQKYIHPVNLEKTPAKISTSSYSNTFGNFTSSHNTCVLIVGDHEESKKSLALLLRQRGIHFAECSIGECFELYRFDEYDSFVVLLDLRDNRELGDLAMLRRMEEHFAAVPVIVLDNIKRKTSEEELIKRFAIVNLHSCDNSEMLFQSIHAAFRFKHLMLENYMIKKSLSIPHTVFKIMGESPVVRKLNEELEAASLLETPVILQGEVNTGKYHAAQIIHMLSVRSKYPFDIISLNLIPLECFKCYLFGCVPGQNPLYPGGLIGKLALTHRGTLFIERINRLQLPEQRMLVSFLKNRSFSIEGLSQKVFANVRIIASCYVDLVREVELGTFDPELYDLLHTTAIRVPPFREIKSDIPTYFRVAVSWVASINRLPIPRIDQSAIDKLMSYSWPNNSFEFEVTAQRAVLSDTDGVLRADDIHWGIYDPSGKRQDRSMGLAGMTMAEVQKKLIMETLERCKGNKSQAAKLLKINERTLYNKITSLGIEE